MTRNRYACFAATLAAALVMATAAVFAQGSYVDPFTLKNREPGKALAREGDVSVGATIRTDERYNKDGLFSGPRGWVYWNYLADPKPYQNPNLWPDKRPTYFFGEMEIPAGALLQVLDLRVRAQHLCRRNRRLHTRHQHRARPGLHQPLRGRRRPRR